MSHKHTYRSRLSWQGSTASGYESYERTHRIELPPASGDLVLSADPAFRGCAELANPEQLLLAAVSSCQLLTFLALAARSRLEILAYQDDAEAIMPEEPAPMRITRVTLRPRITVAAGTDVERVAHLVERGHEACFIANTLNAEVVVESVIEQATGVAPAPIWRDGQTV